jgi:hypothetical protein
MGEKVEVLQCYNYIAYAFVDISQRYGKIKIKLPFLFSAYNGRCPLE